MSGNSGLCKKYFGGKMALHNGNSKKQLDITVVGGGLVSTFKYLVNY